MNTDQLYQTNDPARQPGQAPSPPTTNLRTAATEAGQQIKEKAAEATDQLKNQGAEVLQQAREQAENLVGNQRDQLLHRLSHCSAASRKAAEQLRTDNDPAMANYADALAAQIDRGTEFLRHGDMRGMIAATEDFARWRPEIFFGGMFIAGLALTRFLKASSRSDSAGIEGGRRTWRGNIDEEQNQMAAAALTGGSTDELGLSQATPSAVSGCGC